MKQLIASIYLSFGFLFYMFTFFDNFYQRGMTTFISLLFILVGIIYLMKGISESKKNSKKN
ncbi:hypothetical protein [Heyndrickxia oleronia]|jgi:uncharacterized membrane protein HdeD (DUF308 family)|uniref:hypothetical protein n=1 Tax=Heyndrickxia oleronia TaxID=38875 RepID=UPI002432E8AF|nr:hypothetical protein [Heyndrickxia oleronia]MCI1614233.1 hypothetical protein [Heyndrickxia oleronia]MCI1745111.1 hypothetical protein [Heyndrickxia oleronia]MCI1762195.1 hypothetical protein [Heyndrickxia oleronia]